MRSRNSEIGRRSFLQLAGMALSAAALGSTTNSLTLDEGSEPRSALSANQILRTEPDAQHVGFQNGVQNKGNKGIDWTNWSGAPIGYEGYLADVFIFMQAAVLREPALRARFYRPLAVQSPIKA
jgi:hypothetical protein